MATLRVERTKGSRAGLQATRLSLNDAAATVGTTLTGVGATTGFIVYDWNETIVEGSIR